jgi:hypothetical protein
VCVGACDDRRPESMRPQHGCALCNTVYSRARAHTRSWVCTRVRAAECLCVACV